MYTRVLVIDSYCQEIVQIEDEDLVSSLHNLLNGFFEIVHPGNLPRNIVMLVDDEGMLKDLPIKPLATTLYRGRIFGKAILMREYLNADGEPDLTGLNDLDLSRTLSAIQRVMLGGATNARI